MDHRGVLVRVRVTILVDKALIGSAPAAQKKKKGVPTETHATHKRVIEHVCSNNNLMCRLEGREWRCALFKQ